MTFARQTAVLGTLLLTALTPGAAGAQTASAPPPSTSRATRAARQAPEPQSFPVAQPATPAKPRNYLALLPAPPFNRTTIVLDPGHGGADNGSRISDSTVEKNVTLSLASHLRSLLAARGFNVVMTRDNDDANEKAAPFAPLTLDDRAGIANHERAGACLLLHATSAGSGVHLYTSELAPSAGETVAGSWLTAQAAWVPQSQKLAARLEEALTRSRIPVVNGTASVRPLDSLTCPALVLELAPHTDDPDSINDDDYQQHIAQAIAGALVFWKNAAQPPPHLAPVEPSSATESQP